MNHFVNLQSFKFPEQRNPRIVQAVHRPFDYQDEAAISALFRQNPSLTKVNIERNIRPYALRRTLTEDLPRLEVLNLTSCEVGAWTTKVLFESLPESIKSVPIIVSESEEDDIDNKMGTSPTQSRKHHAPDNLDVELDSTKHEEFILLSFLETCPNPEETCPT